MGQILSSCNITPLILANTSARCWSLVGSGCCRRKPALSRRAASVGRPALPSHPQPLAGGRLCSSLGPVVLRSPSEVTSRSCPAAVALCRCRCEGALGHRLQGRTRYLSNHQPARQEAGRSGHGGSPGNVARESTAAFSLPPAPGFCLEACGALWVSCGAAGPEWGSCCSLMEPAGAGAGTCAPCPPGAGTALLVLVPSAARVLSGADAEFADQARG